MRWAPEGECAMASVCGRYMISRACVGARGLVYTAVRLGSPWPARPGQKSDGWDGSEILGQRTVSDDRAARAAAVAQLKAICEEHAGER